MVESNGHKPDPYEAVRGFVEADGPQQWVWKEKAKDFYSMAEVFRTYFFSPSKDGDYELPPVLVGVENLGVRTLACYYLRENPLGLRYQMSMNSLYLDRPMWEQYESLAHEMIHLYQENNPDLENSKRGYHNREFVAIAEEMGLHPKLGEGWHLKPADGQFAALMARYEVPLPTYVKPDGGTVAPDKGSYWDGDRGKTKGKSTLYKYVCACEPPVNIRSGKSNLTALCKACNSDFQIVN